MFLAAMKLDWNCILPRVDRNYKLSVSTFYFGCAVIYKKLAAEPSVDSREAYKQTMLEKKQMMSLTGVDDDHGTKKKKKKSSILDKCVICKFGSPKYWQLMLNDIPLLTSIPVAYMYSAADFNAIVLTLTMSVIDTIFMLTYLWHTDELSLDAEEVYKKVTTRNEEKEEAVAKIEDPSDESSSSDEDENDSQKIINESQEISGDAVGDPNAADGEQKDDTNPDTDNGPGGDVQPAGGPDGANQLAGGQEGHPAPVGRRRTRSNTDDLSIVEGKGDNTAISGSGAAEGAEDNNNSMEATGTNFNSKNPLI